MKISEWYENELPVPSAARLIPKVCYRARHRRRRGVAPHPHSIFPNLHTVHEPPRLVQHHASLAL